MIAVALAFVMLLLLPSSNALAADPSLMRLLVVPSAGQLSLVVEMSDETRRVSTQQTTATTLLLDAGPVAFPLQRQLLNAPSGLSLVQQVAVDEWVNDEKEHLMRVRVTMKRPSPNSVRIVGRRIYIDFMVPDASLPGTHSRPIEAGAAVGAATTAVDANRRRADGSAFRHTMSGAASQFERIQPFLLSATASPTPNPAVLSAVSEAISTLQESLRGVRPPAEAASSLQLFTSAVSIAAEAVSPKFQGDRTAKARQSVAIFAEAKAQLQ
jgi:hypothetical protein